MGTKTASRRVSRAFHVLAAIGALALIAGFPTEAHAKKQKTLQMDPNVSETSAPAGPVPPEADANGHVNYANPQAEGLGRVTVKSKSGDKVQVYLEGRYFGDAPITIYSVPKGDYIVEGTVVGSGKQLSSPVTVSENEEATVELGTGKIESAAATTSSGTGFMNGDISPRRLLVTKILLGVAAVGVVGAVVFGILEHNDVNDYENANPGNQANLDSIWSRGRRDAGLCDVSIAVAGAGLVGAVIAGYPMFWKTETEKAPADTTTAAFVAPILGNGTTGAALNMRF